MEVMKYTPKKYHTQLNEPSDTFFPGRRRIRRVVEVLYAKKTIVVGRMNNMGFTTQNTNAGRVTPQILFRVGMILLSADAIFEEMVICHQAALFSERIEKMQTSNVDQEEEPIITTPFLPHATCLISITEKQNISQVLWQFDKGLAL